MIPFHPAKSDSSAATYEEFLRDELNSLRDRLLQRHQAAIAGGSRGGLSAFSSPGEDVKGSLPEAEVEVLQEAPWTKTDLSWAELTVSLLEAQDPATEDNNFGGQVMSLRNKGEESSLILRGSWSFSWAEARRMGRQRTQEAQDTRFNDVLEDHSSWFQQFVIGPDSRVQFAWALLATIFIVWDMATIPLEIFPMPSFDRITFVVAIVSLAFWMADMPTHVFFGSQVRGVIEMRPAVLARLYARSWLLIDVLVILVDCALITLEVIRVLDTNPLFRSGRYLRTVRLVRLVRLLRVGKLERQVMVVAHRLLSTYSLMALRVAGYLAVMLAMNHLIACCWYGIGTYTDSMGSWLERSQIDPDNVGEAYIAALHWSLTQFTPATNPIAPSNAWERFYAIWVILLAMACFSSFIGSIGTTITSMRTVRRAQLEQESRLEVFFTERNLSLELFERVKSALQKDKLARTRLREEEVTLISGIPESIKIALHKEMFLSPLLRLAIWPTWSHHEDADFLRTICHNAMHEHTSRPGQDVFLPHTLCHHVSVLQSGNLEYSVHEKEPTLCRGGESVLCLPALWAEWPHRGRLTATFGTCFYVGIGCQAFSSYAASFGGPLCEYLKILGILMLAQIEALEEKGKFVTDISAQEDINTRVLADRAERFASLKESSSMVYARSSSRQRLQASAHDAGMDVVSM